MWLLPSRNRIGNLKRFFRSCREMGVSTPGMVLVNQDEFDQKHSEYGALDLPKGWSVVGVEATCMHDALRAIYPVVRDSQFIGLLQDDLVPGTPGWDTELIRQLSGWNVVCAYDGRSNRMAGAIAWSTQLIKELGWIYPPGTKHLYGDDVWETMGREAGCLKIDPSVVTTHQNETYSLNPDETAKAIVSYTEHDKAVFEEWLKTDKDACVAKIKALKARMGAVDIQVNFSGMSVMIGTPSIDNKFEGSYMQSLSDTMRNLTSANVPTVWAVEKYNADVAMARGKIFSMFLRSPFTHLLMIDADMGWDFGAIMRLIAAKKDFVAVAGPKKSYPLRFAANHTDDNDGILPLQFDNTTGVAEVTEVGAAFALLTKEAAIRIAQSYPELAHQGMAGETDYAVFMPMVYKGRYKAEDFAFCRRWKAIGGKTYICPDVSLSHTGGHTFHGSLMDQFRKNAPVSPIAHAQAAE